MELVQVQPLEGNNPFDTENPLNEGREATGAGEGGDASGSGEPTGMQPGAGGGTTGGSGVPPCSAGPLAIGADPPWVNFSYIESTGECELQPGEVQSGPFLGHGAPVFGQISTSDRYASVPRCPVAASGWATATGVW